MVLALQRRLLLLSFEHGELDWCQCAEAAVWSQVIVVVAPRFDGLARLRQGEENVLVEALVLRLLNDSTKAFCTGLPGSM